MSHVDRVREEFGKQAPTFAPAETFFGARSISDWIGSILPFSGDETVVDVAGGAGHLSRAFADRARQFVVADATRAMLDVGAAAVAEQGIANVLYVEADAYALPFTGGAFDVAMCRFALHHMTEPAKVVAEMARVVRPGGRVALIDMVAIDPALAAEHDRLEILRDPSHTSALSADAVIAALEAAGTTPGEPIFRDQAMEYGRWIGQSKPSAEAAAEVTAAIEAEADGSGAATGLRAARTDDGGLTVMQRWMCVVARIPPV